MARSNTYPKMASYSSRYREPCEAVLVSALMVIAGMFFNSSALYLWLSFPYPLSTSKPYVTNARTGVSYQGISTNGVQHFQNIFYAEDTSGINRFAPPVSYMPPRGTVVDATIAGAWCPQGMGAAPLPFTSPITNTSENCLSLRIARPAGIDPSARLPVFVWLHGGKIPKISPKKIEPFFDQV